MTHFLHHERFCSAEFKIPALSWSTSAISDRSVSCGAMIPDLEKHIVATHEKTKIAILA